MQKVQHITANLSNYSYIYIQEVEKEIEAAKANNPNNFTQGKKQKVISHNKEDVKYSMLICAEEKPPNQPNMEFPEINAKAGIPRNLPNGNFLLRLVWTSFDYLTTKTNLQKKMIIGGLFDVTFFNALPQPKPFKNYLIKAHRPEDDSLEVLPFPKPGTDNTIVITKTSSKLKVGYQLPKNIFMEAGEEPKMIQWVPETEEWTEDYVDDIEPKAENVIEMSTKRLTPIAYFQPRTVDFPYTQWKLRSVSEKIAILDIKGKRLGLKFEIGQGYVLLRETGFS